MAEFILLVVVALVIGFMICKHSPAHWQTPLGLVIVSFVALPIGVMAITLLAMPGVLVPAAFIGGIILSQTR